MIEALYSKKLKKTIKRSITLIEGILPFTQRPSENCFNVKKDDVKSPEMKGDDLFSLFTANIIKEEIVFTR